MAKEKTKSRIVAEAISAKILHGEYALGERLPSERELAEALGVSRDTVRQGYNILEKTGLLKRVRGAGTHISTELRGHSEPVTAVALVCPEFYDRFGMKFVVSLEEALSDKDTLMILKISKNPHEDDKVLLELMQKGINNFIIWPNGSTELNSVCYRLRALGANLVFFDRVIPEEYADFIGIDNDDAVNKLMDHARGRDAEVYTFLSLAEIVGDSTEIRKSAFVSWCKKNNYDYDVFQSGEGGVNSCMEKMLGLHESDRRRRAYVCVNDDTALELVAAQKSAELVYSIDGLVVGNSNGLVTIEQPLEEMAAKAVEMIFQQRKMGDRWKARRIMLKGELIE